MSFYLSSNITIGNYKNVKPNKIVWKTDVGNFIDTCVITLPRRIHFRNEYPVSTWDFDVDAQKDNIYQFKEGDKVSVLLGYNKRNVKRFEGFIRLVKMGVPVQLECEGYGYQLYDIVFNKTYTEVSVKTLLKDLIKGTDISLSAEIPDIPLSNVRFKNATGIQVLEWLKNEVKLAVYFNFNELYVGTLYGKVQKRVKVRIGWNTVSDDDFQKKKVDKTVQIVIREKNAKGEVKKTRPDEKKYSDEKELKIKAGIPSVFLKQIANRLQTKENYKGYEGDIKLFLEPFVNKGMSVDLNGWIYPEKTGLYFVQAVSGEYGTTGGRQTVTLGFLMDGNTGTA